MPRKTINTDIDRRGAAKGSQNGQEAFVPTEKQRDKVIELAATGTPQERIGAHKFFRNRKYPHGISLSTLTRHFREELDKGAIYANAKVGGVLFNQALDGNVRAIEQWFDRRGGQEWKRRVTQEHSGPDGGPIRYSDLSDEELDAKLKALSGDSPVETNDDDADSRSED